MRSAFSALPEGSSQRLAWRHLGGIHVSTPGREAPIGPGRAEAWRSQRPAPTAAPGPAVQELDKPGPWCVALTHTSLSGHVRCVCVCLSCGSAHMCSFFFFFFHLIISFAQATLMLSTGRVPANSCTKQQASVPGTSRAETERSWELRGPRGQIGPPGSAFSSALMTNSTPTPTYPHHHPPTHTHTP